MPFHKRIDTAHGRLGLLVNPSPADENEIQEEMAIWEEVTAEEHAWHARLLSGKVEMRNVRVDWSPVVMTHFFEGGEEVLMSLAGALYDFHFSPRDDINPHAEPGEKYPETPAEVAAFLEHGDDAERMAALITPARWRRRQNRLRQGFPADPPGWRD